MTLSTDKTCRSLKTLKKTPSKPPPRLLNTNPNPLNILKLVVCPNLQLLTATHPCIRTRQGQHYRHDVACLEQEFNYTLARGRFKSRGDSLVAVKTILPIQTPIYINEYVEIKLIYDYPEILLSQSQLTVADLVLLEQAKCLNLKTAAMSSTPWKYHLRQVTIVAPRVAQ